MGIGGQTITQCSICGGTAGSTAGHSSRECVTNLRSRLDDAERLLTDVRQWDHLDCAADGSYWKLRIDNYFERWK
jgi:hypothetical protein